MKKSIFSPVFSLMMLQLVAQTKTVNIQGFVKDTTVKRIEISHLLDDKLTKWENTNLNVVNGAFNTSIQLPFPLEINISYGNRVYSKKYIYSDSKILIDTDGEPQIIGSPIQDEYEKEFLPFFQTNDKFFDSVQSFFRRNHLTYGKDFPTLIQDSGNLLKQKYCSQRAELLAEYIKVHPDSYVALWNIYYFIAMPGKLDQYFHFEKLFSSFSNQLKQQSFIHDLKEKVKESYKIQVGEVFPKDFLKGYEQMQSKIRKNSQYYVIDFWYSHCGPCAKAFPKLKEIYNQFHGKGFDIISISVDKQKDKKDYLAAIKKHNLTWNQVWDKDGLAAEKFNINAFPTYILLDKNDRIINYDIEASQLEAFLKEKL